MPGLLLANLAFVAFFGVLMRYKIGFEFPWFDQKFLQHAHSHFAFTGWITQALMWFIYMAMREDIPQTYARKYAILFVANILAAYGMLIAFSIQGYGAVSITFSTISVFLFYYFIKITVTCLSGNKEMAREAKWFRASFFFYVLSSAGSFYLAYLMATRSIDQNWHLASVYFFLHFQYNGWFLFASIGILLHYLRTAIPAFTISEKIFPLFFWSCIPAYFLSTLWAPIPVWLYALVVVAAFAQVVAVYLLLKAIIIQWKNANRGIPRIVGFFYFLAGICLCIKVGLQLFSTVPAISKLAFGFRPIVIAYLHLVLLAVISLFLITHLYAKGYLAQTVFTRLAMLVTATGIFLNELVLMIQGVASFSYTLIPFVNLILFIVAILIFIGIILLFAAQTVRNESKLTG